MYNEQNNITMLFFRHKPRSLDEVQDMLDNNGYAGRNKPVMVRKQGAATDLVKVAITLPDSGFTYNWPLENYYNLRTGKLDKKVKVKPNPRIKYAMEAILNKPHLFRPGQRTALTIAGMEYCLPGVIIGDQLVYQMMQFGLLDNNNVCPIKKQEEINELSDNLYDISKYSLLT